MLLLKKYMCTCQHAGIRQMCCAWWSTYSYISLRGNSVARHEEGNQISYIFQIHFTLKTGCDYYVFFGTE